MIGGKKIIYLAERISLIYTNYDYFYCNVNLYYDKKKKKKYKKFYFTKWKNL
jgi:hypothetical protein